MHPCHHDFVEPPDLRFLLDGTTHPIRYTPENLDHLTLARLIDANELHAIESLLASSNPADPRVPCGNTPLMTAARRDLRSVISSLLLHGADVDAPQGTSTPLSFAAQARHYEAARLLIAAGATSAPAPPPVH